MEGPERIGPNVSNDIHDCDLSKVNPHDQEARRRSVRSVLVSVNPESLGKSVVLEILHLDK